MKAERWQQVEQIYHAALKRSAEERAAFLGEACAGDEELRHEVESLLAYDDQAENFIEAPALEVAAKMMAEDTEANVSAGQTINHYRITAPLGAGGMGEVYLGDDTRLQRKVALKFLPEHLTQDKHHLQRFQQEARAVAALSHPNVCMIHEVIETGEGRHCIVMEYVDGLTLRDRAAQGRMNVGDALDVAIQVASALAAAHEAGIVHRDIKPENIMLRRDGYVKILDFGLAKLTETKSEPLDSQGETRALELKTTPGVVMGTVAYMSPEQARGLAVDARTDLWSLGVVVYEMVAGRKPFEGATPTDVIISIAEREPVPLTKVLPEVPIQLERIVKKTLAKDREQRYQTADGLLKDLKSLTHDLEIGAEVERYKQTPSGDETSAVTTGEVSRPSQLRLTRRSMLTVAAFAGVLILAGLVYAKFFRNTTPATTEIKSLAVLPLENISGDASQDYLADGMTESLITDFSRIGALRVMSRASVMHYKGARKSLAEIGRELKVDAVLAGSVQRSGSQLKIGVQLIHSATDQNLWDKSYEQDLRDVLVLQRNIVEDIRIKLTPQQQVQLGAVRPVNPEAYDHYLRGRFYLHRQNKDDNETAILALERAVATDPSFAAAHAELAQAYVWKLFLFAPGEKQLEEKAFVAVEKALALDPESAAAYLARGRLLWTPANHFPHDRAIKEYRRALSLNPNLDEARNQLALVYCHVGAFPEALQESQLALAADPSNHLAQYRAGQTLNFQGKYDEALSVLRSIPDDANPALVGAQIAWASYKLGKKDETSALLEQLLKDHPEDTGGAFTGLQALLAASAGQERVAEEKIKSAIEKGKGFGHFHHTAYQIACAYALMNKPEQAVKWLETAANDGFPCYPLFETETDLNKVRQDAHFLELMAKLKRQWDYYQTILYT